MRSSAIILSTVLLAPSTGVAFSADVSPPEGCAGPCLIYTGTFDLNADWLHPDDGSVGNSVLVGIMSENNFQLKATDAFSIFANIIVEPVEDALPGEDQIFAATGAYVDILRAQYDFENLSIWGGKIHPAFGRASDVVPGLHGTDLVDNYDLTERLGGGASFSFDAGGLANLLQASAFTTDRTILSESLFVNRGRKSLVDGGAGNTGGGSSFAMALEGCKGAEMNACYDEGNFGYQLAVRYQNGGEGSDANEIGLLGSLNKSIALADDTKLRLFGEAAWFKNYDGTADDATFVTVSSALELGSVNTSLSYTQQRILVAGGADTTEHLVDATIMYALGDAVSAFGEKWAVGAGYSADWADGEKTQTIGLKLTSEFGGNVPF